jgi:hypothetical protein
MPTLVAASNADGSKRFTRRAASRLKKAGRYLRGSLSATERNFAFEKNSAASRRSVGMPAASAPEKRP